MVKQILPAIAIIILLGSCSTMKPLNFSSNRPVAVESNNSSSPKFIDEITSSPKTSKSKTDQKETFSARGISIDETKGKTEHKTVEDMIADRSTWSRENVSALQRKYGSLLNTESELLQNEVLLEGIDEWYGTHYRMGGTTKKGIDCSAFVCAIYAAVYSITLPRTAYYQYKGSRRVPRTELQEGDLLFFNTRGGVSHVGIYLQNNKFVHASATKGVTISDMFEPYYLQHFIGAGRVDKKLSSTAALNP